MKCGVANSSDQLPHRLPHDLAWIPIWIAHGNIGGLIDVRFLHTKFLQSSLHLELLEKHVQAVNGVAIALGESLRELSHRFRNFWCIISQSVRQDSGMCLSVRKTKGTAQRVAELVVQTHPDGSETGTAEPCAVQSFRPRFQV